MEVKNSTICHGCLSCDQKIDLIENIMIRQCYLQIINENFKCEVTYNLELWLCSVCDAQFTNFIQFKQRVVNSYRNLNSHIKSIHTEEPINICSYKTTNVDTDLNLETHVKIESFKSENSEELISSKQTDDIQSIYSDHIDDETTIVDPDLGFKKSKKKNRVKRKSKKKCKELEVVREILLSKKELLEERKTLAQNEGYVNAMFRCERCILSFPNNDDFKDHVELKHNAKDSKFTCDVCECTFTSEVSYNYHTNRHMRRYQCTACMEMFQSKRAVTKHYEIEHYASLDLHLEVNGQTNGDPMPEVPPKSNDSANQNGVAFPCEFCNKSFRWKTSLRKHVETHRIETGQKRKPYCEPCRLSFTTTANLQKHVKTSSKHQIQLKVMKLNQNTETIPDGTEKQTASIEQIKRSVCEARQRYPCEQCGKSFQWKGNLQRHALAHRDRANGELVCVPCNRSFSSIATYKQHMRISKKHVSESDFNYICSDCGKRFANKTRLKDHVDWEHLKNYVHTCDICQKVFKSHTSLYLHKQVVHKTDSAQHLCDHCGKHFPARELVSILNKLIHHIQRCVDTVLMLGSVKMFRLLKKRTDDSVDFIQNIDRIIPENETIAQY